MQKRWMNAAAVFAVLALTSCSELPITSETEAPRSYSDAQMMIVIATERNRYREVYTDQIWQVEVDQEGTTFQAYLLREIHEFMEVLLTLNRMADEQKFRLTGQEKEQLSELTDQYYSSLTQADLSYIGASQEEVYELYEQYHRANRMADELTKDINLEISDSEAKVIVVEELVVKDEETARQLYGQAMMEGTNFESLVRSVSEDSEIEKHVGRGEREKEYEDVVFSVGEGQISEVISLDGKYYIVKVTDEYDEEATQERKERLSLQRKDQAFHQIYDTFAAANPVEFDGEIWNAEILSKGEESVTADFFTLYHEYMDPQ